MAEDLGTQLAELETRMAALADQTAAFDSGLVEMGQSLSDTNREMAGLSRSLGSGLRRAFDGVVFDGLRASDAMRQLGQSISDAVYRAAIRPGRRRGGGMMLGWGCVRSMTSKP